MVKSGPVSAFMYVLKLRFIMLKNGSRTGNLALPHSTVCSSMCATPVLSIGCVAKPHAKKLFESSVAMCMTWAPVASCS
jgi:hypothetical protein